MVTPGNILKISLIIWLLWGACQAYAKRCTCEFDTSTYSAVAEGEGYCGSVTKKGKDCSITYNGNVDSQARIKPSSIYGPIEQYAMQMRAINSELFQTRYLVAARDPSWLTRNLPLMIRSAYATAPFLTYEEREILDKAMKIFSKNYGRDVYSAMTGKQGPLVKDNFEVSKEKVKFKEGDVVVVFEMTIAAKF
jgi:hypothetical protein